MQAVAAAAGVRIVDASIEVILAQKPAKCAASFAHPKTVARSLEGFGTSRHRGVCLERLLIKARSRFAPAIKPVRADGPEMAALGALCVHKPTERLETDFTFVRQLRVLAGGGDNRLSKTRVVVRAHVLEPTPARSLDSVVQVDQPFDELDLNARSQPIPFQAA